MLHHIANISSIVLAFLLLVLGWPWTALLLGILFVVSTPRPELGR
jgi:hypothetical protein